MEYKFITKTVFLDNGWEAGKIKIIADLPRAGQKQFGAKHLLY